MEPLESWDVTHFRRLEAAWGAFVTARSLPAQVDPAVVRSWQRCAPRLNPEAAPFFKRVPDHALNRRLTSLQRLIEAAKPEMEDMYQAIEGSRTLVLLTDASLCLLEMVGHPATARRAASLGIRPGLYWSETSLGTNAFALAHREGRPVVVAGAEHYLRWFHQQFTAAAPIHTADGRMVGIVGLLGPLASGSAYVGGVVLGAARAIEASMGRLDFTEQLLRQEGALQAVLDAVAEPVILWDLRGQITHLNAPAAQCLGVEQRAVVGRPLEEQVVLPAGVWERLRQGHAVGEVALRRPGSQEMGPGRGALRGRALPLLFGPDERPRLFLLILREAGRLRPAAPGPRAERPPELAGFSPYAQRIRKLVEAAQRGQGPVVVEGEFGLSRETVARLIHQGSERRYGPWVALNCSGLAPGDLVAALAGTRAGPGQPRTGGLLAMAQGGTLFLDSAELLPEEAQRLLLVLLQRKHLPSGGGLGDVRVMVGITQPLRELVRRGSLRKDLAVALDCFAVDLRPLRERRSDLPAIIRAVLERHAAAGLPRATLSAEAEELLLRHPWPGNTTELAHVLEQAVLVARDGVIRPHHLPQELRHHGLDLGPARVKSVEEAELETILQAGWATGGRVTQMAALLGISRTTVWRRLRKAGIHPSFFKTGHRADGLPVHEDVAP
ncbi:sigma-54-dependent Fis family transcriptional regulator [Limnochorda pilosa]|uniref:sigma-54-dependent Fis family transcriptional regulator n=1 Tax=Limnochorda pilosa TaxID=1555112 RepID=UPI0026EBD772|nr:sigma 54-interacting transcriptional regulator [Limnochorda pilosa]